MNQLKLLFLCDEIMSYFESVIHILATKYQAQIIMVEQPERKRTSYIAGKKSEYTYLTKKQFFSSSIHHEQIFDLVFVAGWFDLSYLDFAKKQKAKGSKVICGFDTFETNPLMLLIKSISVKFKINNCFTHFWVPGKPQADFANYINSKNLPVLQNLYTADTNLFKPNTYDFKDRKRLLFVGRLEKIKGIDLLYNSFKELYKNFQDWELIIIGSGSLSNIILPCPGVKCYPFMSSSELNELTNQCSVFVLPSRKEPWGIVLHEFAAKGFVLICSDKVGSSSVFLNQNENGFKFKHNNAKSISDILTMVMQKPLSELTLMGQKSYELSKRISPEISAETLMNIYS